MKTLFLCKKDSYLYSNIFVERVCKLFFFKVKTYWYIFFSFLKKYQYSKYTSIVATKTTRRILSANSPVTIGPLTLKIVPS